MEDPRKLTYHTVDYYFTGGMFDGNFFFLKIYVFVVMFYTQKTCSVSFLCHDSEEKSHENYNEYDSLYDKQCGY